MKQPAVITRGYSTYTIEEVLKHASAEEFAKEAPAEYEKGVHATEEARTQALKGIWKEAKESASPAKDETPPPPKASKN